MDWTATLLDALQLMLRLSAPVLIAVLLASLFSSVLQAATQAGDASLSFVPRWLAVALALFLCRDFYAQELVAFTSHMLSAMSQLGR